MLIGYDFNYWFPDKDLYVAAKFDNFKQEILEYKYLNTKAYYKQIIPKANTHHNTIIVKALQSEIDIGINTKLKKEK